MKKAIMSPIHNILALTKTVGSSFKTDGWFNILTGLGMQGKDPRMGMDYRWNQLTETDVEHLTAIDDVASRVVHYVPREGTRKWIDLRMLGDSDPKPAKAVTLDLERLQAQSRVRKAWAWSRQYGGAGIFLAVDDGMELMEPLDLKKIRRVKALTVLNRHELTAHGPKTSDLADPNFGEPELYSLTPRQTSDVAGAVVHHSRIIKFHGKPLGRTLNEINDNWGDSVLNAMLNAIRNFNLAHDSTAAAINDFRVGILKLKDLAQLIAADQDNAVMQRIQLMQYSKSVLSAIALDAESEDFEQRDTKLAGLKDALDQVNQRLVAATEMPHTVILGEGATGTLGGGGQSEERNINKFVEGLQEEHLTDPLNRLIEVVQAARQGPTAGRILEDLTWCFVPLGQPTEKDKADVHKTQAEADKIYWEMGAVDSDEIRKSRFGTEEYSTETSVDLDRDIESEPSSGGEGGELNPSETVQGNVDQDEEPHDHYDFILGTFMGETVGDASDPNHRHLRTNGVETGSAIHLPDGSHVHELSGDPGAMSGPDVLVSVLRGETCIADAEDSIRKIGGRFFVFSESGDKRLGGPFKTRSQAEKRLREIEHFKSKDYEGEDK